MTRSRDDDDLPLSRIPPVDDDVRRELEFHLEQRAAELEAEGHTREEARAIAHRYFGDRRRHEAECREIESRRRAARRRERRLEALRHDVRLGLRMLGRSPGFTAAAVLTLALGVGANTTVFSIVNSVLLRPLAYEEPDRLVTVVERHERGYGNIPWTTLQDLEAQSRSFRAIAAYGAGPHTVLDATTAHRMTVAWISAGFFGVFPVRAVIGRLPSPEEHRIGAAPVAVVSHAFWRDRLGAPPSLDGVRVRIGATHDVIGVLPAEFDFPAGTQVWQPLELSEQPASRTAHNWNTVARLAAGVTPVAAERETDAILAGLRAVHFPDFDAVGSTVTPLQEFLTGSTRRPLYLLLGASALLLLGACANLAGALLARGAARSGELAVRSALGATRTRLVRQLLTEGALLSVLGCAAGVLLAVVVLRGLTALAPPALPLPAVRIDGWVIAFAATMAVITVLLFGLLPALRLSEGGTSAVLRSGARGTADARRVRAWNLLVTVEVALAVVLLTGSALLLRSFARVLDSALGFDPAHVLAARVNLPSVNYDGVSPAIAGFHGRVLEALRREPGVAAVGFANVLPLEGNNPSGAMEVEGKPHDPRGRFNGYAVYRVIGGEYFRAMGTRLVAGRVFGPGDDGAALPVTIVSETFARSEWPADNPLGKRVRPAGMDRGSEPWYVVIGVVADVRGASMIDPYREVYYFDHRQRPPYRTNSVTYVARTVADPAAFGAAVQRAVASIDPQVPVEARPLSRHVMDSLADRRFTLALLGAFAAVALFLTIVGIYAVVSYSVARRTREIGVRIALGGTPAGMRRMVIGAAMRAVAPGLVLGALLALAGSSLMRSLLYGVSPFDVAALASAVVGLGAAAAISSLLPARRATRVDPMLAIRSE